MYSKAKGYIIYFHSSDPCAYSKYGGIHKITELEHMQEAVNKVEESIVRNITCASGPRCLAMVEGKCMMFSHDEKAKNKKPTPRKWAWGHIPPYGSYLGQWLTINLCSSCC